MKREIDKIFSKHDDLTENHSIDSIFNALNNIEKEVVYAIESRTCGNCKYFNEFNRCTNGVIQNTVSTNNIHEDVGGFGCNKFKRKGE